MLIIVGFSYHDSIGVHDCVKTVRDGQHCAILKLLSDGGLD